MSSSFVYSWRESTPTLTTTVIGDFSVDGDDIFPHERRNLGKVTLNWGGASEKTVHYDLNKAIDKARRKNKTPNYRKSLSKMLEWLLFNKSFLSPAPDFVSGRRTLRRVILAKHSTEEIVFYATKFRNTIYVCAALGKDEVQQAGPERDRMSAWGYKFEHFLTDGSDPSTGMDENKSYVCVIRAKLGAHTLIYGGEVDGVDSKLYTGNRLPNADELVELKTEKKNKLCYTSLNRYKLRDTWVQCALTGIPRVVVGYRDDGGVVHQLKVLKVNDFPRLANGFFSSDELMTYLNAFLRRAKSTVTLDDPNKVYELKIRKNTFRSRLLAADDVVPVDILSQRYVEEIGRQ